MAGKAGRFRFGTFEFDAGSGELRRLDGHAPAQRLPPQPARLLALLLEQQGGIVSRDEIREALWPGTHVDFDDSLHFCVRQVRAALADSASNPGYVETVPRRGYRLMLPVSSVPVSEAIVSADVRSRVNGMSMGRWTARFFTAAAAVVALAGGYSVLARPAAPPPAVRIGIMPFQPPPALREPLAWQPIAEWILLDLARAGGSAAVVGPTTTAAYDPSDDGLRRLAGDYRLEYVVNSRFLEGARGPRMLAELIRLSDGAHVWVQPYTNLSEGERIGHEIAHHVASLLKLEQATAE